MRKTATLLMAALLAGPCLATERAFMQVVQRAELGTFDLKLPADLRGYLPAERDLIESLYALGQLDQAAADTALQRYRARNDQDVGRQREYYSLVEDFALLRAQYAQAEAAGTALRALPGAEQQPDYQASLQTLGIARLLRAVPPVRLPDGVVAGTLPVTRDAVGLTRITVTINGQTQEAVVDTGASFSVVSVTTAKKLGLTALQGEAKLGSSVSAEISSQIAVAGQVQVGATRFESVVLLVLDDAQLTFPVPGGYSIPAILGFPELRRLERLAFDDAAMHVGTAAPTGGSRNLSFADGRLYVDTDVAGACVPLHLDTGASASELTRLYADRHPAQLQTLKHQTRHLGGAGGVTESDALNWQGAEFRVGDRQVVLPQLDVSQAKEILPPPRFGTLGRDVLSKGYGMDFVAMQLWIKGDASATANACRRRAATAARSHR